MSELQTVSITIGILTACISVVIGVVNSILSNRRAEKQRELTLQTQQQALETRQVQLFMQIYSRFSDYQVARSFSDTLYTWEWSDAEDYFNKYGPETNPEENAKAVSVSRFIDGIGWLVKRNLIDIQLVEDLMRDVVIRYWDRMSPIREYGRYYKDSKKIFDGMEYLYNLMKQRQQATISP